MPRKPRHLMTAEERDHANAVARSSYRLWRQANLEKARAKGRKDQNRRNRRPEIKIKSRDQYLRRQYGITLQEYETMHAAQGGRCAICRMPETKVCLSVTRTLAVDHCHKTGKVRGLLCGSCNVLIGHAGEDTVNLMMAIAYLESHAK